MSGLGVNYGVHQIWQENVIKRVHTIVVEIFDDMREVLLGLFVEVGHSDTSGEDGIIRMRRPLRRAAMRLC